MSTVVVEGPGISKTDKSLVQAILGGEMKNAWEPTKPGESQDERPEKAGQWSRPSRAYLANYERIFGK